MSRSSWDIFREVGQIVEMGGSGSGNRGHKGVKGQKGGSAPKAAPVSEHLGLEDLEVKHSYKDYIIGRPKSYKYGKTNYYFFKEGKIGWMGHVSKHPGTGEVQASVNALTASTLDRAKYMIDTEFTKLWSGNKAVFAISRDEARQKLIEGV